MRIRETGQVEIHLPKARADDLSGLSVTGLCPCLTSVGGRRKVAPNTPRFQCGMCMRRSRSMVTRSISATIWESTPAVPIPVDALQ